MGSMVDKGVVLVLHHNFSVSLRFMIMLEYEQKRCIIFKIGNSVNKFNMVQGKFEGVGNLETDINNICGKTYFSQWITRHLPWKLANNFRMKSTRTTYKMEKEYTYPQKPENCNHKHLSTNQSKILHIFYPRKYNFRPTFVVPSHLLPSLLRKDMRGSKNYSDIGAQVNKKGFSG